MERNTGKTLKMVQELEPNSVICIHNKPMRDYISNMICDIKGKEFLNTIKFFTVGVSNIDSLKGLKIPIKVDHAVYDQCSNRYINELEDFLSVYKYR